MKSFSFLASQYKLSNPLAYMRINQVFGSGDLSFYKDLGMLGHNGIDLRASMDTPTFACFPGQVVYAGTDGTGGKSVRIRSKEVDVAGVKYRLEAVYYHLNKWDVVSGDNVGAGDVVGLTGNTGKYTTGPHLHFEIKPEWFEGGAWKKDYANGYFGAIDPIPFLEAPGWDKLPVDSRYGREKSWLAEFNMRFKNTWLHQQFYKRLKRHPTSITNRELHALVYGGWAFEEVFENPAFYVLWTVQTKADYLAKKPRPKPFDVHPFDLT